jgi:hypothetical protein
MNRRLRPYLWTLLILWVLPAAAFTAAYYAMPHKFGTLWDPADKLALVAAFLGIPLLLGVGVIAVICIAIWQAKHRKKDKSSASAGSG